MQKRIVLIAAAVTIVAIAVIGIALSSTTARKNPAKILHTETSQEESQRTHRVTITHMNTSREAGSIAAHGYTRRTPKRTLTRNCEPRELQVALYDGPGVWNSGLEALKTYLESRHIRYSIINATEIRNGKLLGYNILIVPGGWAYDYYKSLGPSGETAIREFVKKGGGYIGICAGAYLAARAIIWEAGIYHYSLGIANVIAEGPKENYPWPTQALVKINITDAGIKMGLNKTYTVLYYGGPEFNPLDNRTVILAVYSDDGKPAIILTRYGKGYVALTGVHLEVREQTWHILDILINYTSNCTNT